MRLPIPLLAAAAVAMVSACAAGSAEDDGAGGSGEGGLNWSGSSSSGSGGATGGGSAAGGSGGMQAGSGGGGTGGSGGRSGSGPGGGGPGGGGSGGTGGGGGGGGGGAEQLLMFAAGSPSALAGHYAPGPGWTTVAVPGAGSGAQVAAAGPGSGLAVTRASATNLVRYSVYNGLTWSAFSDIAATVTAQQLRLDRNAAAGNYQLLFHGLDFMHYHSIFTGTVWSPTVQPVQPMAGPQSFGPSAAAVADDGANTLAAYAGNDTVLYTQLYTAGGWQAAQPVAGSHIQQPPVLVVPAAGPQMFAVWINHEPNMSDDKKLFWSARTAGLWSTPAKISDSVFTDDPIEAAALAGGDVLVAYRGTDGKPYTVRYNGSWAAAVPVAANNPDVVAAPALSPGADGAVAELLYVATGGGLHHSRLVAGSWTMPVSLGGSGLSAVDLTRVP